MKKILLATAMIAMSSLGFAAPPDTAIGATGGGGSTTVNTTDCTLISADVKITLSAANVGNVSCDATTANIGVAAGNLNGKGNIYSIGSTGGGITVTSGITDLTETNMRAQSVTQSTARSASTS
jgi:hypothetical protein